MSKPTTRQRMERLVKRYEFRGWDIKAGVEAPYIEATDAIRLLLAEHRRLRAKVRDLRLCGFHAWSDNPDFIAGYEQACEDILKALT